MNHEQHCRHLIEEIQRNLNIAVSAAAALDDTLSNMAWEDAMNALEILNSRRNALLRNE